MSRVPYTLDELKKLRLVWDDKRNGYVQISEGTPVHKVEKINIDFIPQKPQPVFDTFKLKQQLAQLEMNDKNLPRANKKIMNATKSVNDEGIKFDSNLERYMYGLLKGAGIDFDFQVEYVLQEKFRYNSEAVRAITLTVDFLLSTRNVIIDTKGMQTQQGAMRYKMLKRWLIDNWRTFDPNRVLPAIHQPSNKKECDLLLNKLLYGD